MKEEHMWTGVSGLGWAGRTWRDREQKMVTTMREAMLLSASLLLVLLKVMKTVPPDSAAKIQSGSDRGRG